MVDRFLAWLGAGVVAVGVSGGMLAGAGIAAANDGSSSDGGGATTSESSNPAGGKDNSGEDASGLDGSSAKGSDAKGSDAKDSDEESKADDPTTDTDEDATDVKGAGGDTTDADRDTDAAVDESTHKKSFGSRETNASIARVKQADISDENDDADGDAAAKVMAEKTEKGAVDTGNEPETTFAQRKSVVIDNPRHGYRGHRHGHGCRVRGARRPGGRRRRGRAAAVESAQRGRDHLFQPLRPGDPDPRRTTGPAGEQQGHGEHLDTAPRLRLQWRGESTYRPTGTCRRSRKAPTRRIS